MDKEKTIRIIEKTIFRILIVAALFALALGTIEPTRLAQIEDLKNQIIELNTQQEETIASYEEQLQNHRNQISKLYKTKQEEIETRDARISELESTIEGNQMVANVSGKDFELLYEYYFLMGLLFYDEIEEYTLRLASSQYNNMVRQPRTEYQRRFQLKLKRLDMLTMTNLFEHKFIGLDLARALSLDYANSSKYITRINPNFLPEREYVLEYMESFFEIRDRFNELDIPYSTRLTEGLLTLNFSAPSSENFRQTINSMLPRGNTSISGFLRNKEMYNDWADLDTIWEEAYINPQVSYE